MTRWFAAVSVLVATGCSTSGSLEGSIGDDLSLEFNEVRVVVQSDVVRIEYVRNIGDRALKVCKVSVARAPLVGGYNFLADAAFLEHVTVTRVVDGEGPFPEVATGVIELFDLDLTFQRPVSGEFSVEFVTGRTLRGHFDAEPIVLD